MLEILIKEKELYDEVKQEFVTVPEKKIRLEHSLVSISKWESKWKKPFLKPNYVFAEEEFLDYIRCMTITQNVPVDVYKWMDRSEMKAVKDYINEERTATKFNDLNKQNKRTRQIVTSELIYYWMTAYNIPIECQCWHLSRLLTLIRICSIKNSPGKKMSKNDIINQNRHLNEERKKLLGSRG